MMVSMMAVRLPPARVGDLHERRAVLHAPGDPLDCRRMAGAQCTRRALGLEGGLPSISRSFEEGWLSESPIIASHRMAR